VCVFSRAMKFFWPQSRGRSPPSPPPPWIRRWVRVKCHKTDKSPGPDQLHSKVLFEVRNEIVAPLAHLFKLSTETATLPYDWKTGKITVIHKNGSRANVSNNRPVLLRSVVCKTAESLIRNHIMFILYLIACSAANSSAL